MIISSLKFREKLNANLFRYENIFLGFYKKIFKYLISYAKDKKEKLEQLIDWFRKLIVRREKTQKCLLSILENEYINMLNAMG